ncbi:M42 family metallopeptidase [uncultured Clostridium sp.]|uniref:M42 family metallopeptidase n=1 Tax=uncultured Clostridium sp. TaxID=59620 RepID=UPI0025D5EB93|nr:M42 family peptidase [uncultured Clostridium sp.]
MLLEKLCNSAGPSGNENETRKIIMNELGAFTENIDVDRMGNIIVYKNSSSSSLKVMVVSHMDEFSLIITGYNGDGTLRFLPVGYVDKNSLPCKTVRIGNKKIPGVIGIKPIHLQNRREVNKSLSCENMCIDIGAFSEKECRKIVSLGDLVVFDNKFSQFGNEFFEGKALNDRIGCSILVELLKENYKCNLYGVFNVQGRIGQRGIYAAAYNIKPDAAIILDTVNGTDEFETLDCSRTIKLKEGPVIPFKGGESIFDRGIVKSIRNQAANMDIPYQKTGDTQKEGELKAVNLAAESCKISAVLVPCRYMNSNISLCSKDDCHNTFNLLKNYLKKL